MKKVSFTEMKKGTKDYLFLDEHERKYANQTADELKFMSGLTETLEDIN